MHDNPLITFFILLLFLAAYFLPALTASMHEKRASGAIFALNLLLGWTLLGWVIAFVWALVPDRKD